MSKPSDGQKPQSTEEGKPPSQPDADFDMKKEIEELKKRTPPGI